MAKRNLYTNYDALSLIKDCVRDDKIRFPFIAGCVLTGSFDLARKQEVNIDNVVDDIYKIDTAEGVFLRLDPIFSVVNCSRESDINGLLDDLTKKYFSELKEEASKFDAKTIFRHCSKSDLYIYSLRFELGIDIDNKDVAIKEVGQRCEQVIINLYNNKSMNLCNNPNKRTPSDYKKAMCKEAFFLANVVENSYEKYMG